MILSIYYEKSVCFNNRELPEFYNLKVNTAVFWKKTDQVNDLKTWSCEVLKCQKTLNFSMKNQNLTDERTRKWVAFPIKNFIGPLLEKRKNLKILLKDEENEVFKGEINAQQKLKN